MAVYRLTRVALLTLLVLPRAGVAQNHFLAHDHWARGVIHRLVSLGALPPEAGARAWPMTWRTADQLFASVTSHAAAPIAAAYRSQLIAQQDTARSGLVRFGPGLVVTRNQLRAGTMQRADDDTWVYPGPSNLPDHQQVEAVVEAALDVSRFVTLGAQSRGSELETAYVRAGTETVDAWVGRRSFTLGSAQRGDLILNEPNAFEGAGIAIPRGFGIAGIRIRADAILARLERSGAIDDPYFQATRLTLTPADNFTVGLTRALILGGDGNEPVTLRRILLSAIGLTDVEGKDSDFENQVAAADITWRVGATTVFAQLGADDSGWAFLNVPGVVVGVERGQLGNRTDWTVGAEVVHIEERCCSYPPWYVHGALGDGWTDRGLLLGHPLAGAGTQAALNARFDRADGFIATVQLFARDRAAENLFAPAVAGQSAGARVELNAARGSVNANALVLAEFSRTGRNLGQLRVTVTVGL